MTVSEFYTGVNMREEPEEYREKNDRLDMGNLVKDLMEQVGWI